MYSLCCIDADGGCKYAKEIKASRTYGFNIPPFAQGAIFPGDEAHIECELTGEWCDEDCCPILDGEASDPDAYESQENREPEEEGEE